MRKVTGLTLRGWFGVSLLSAVTVGLVPTAARAQTPDPAAQAPAEPPAATKRFTLAGAVDFSNAYFFRGIYQEAEGLVIQPYVDLGAVLYEGEGALKGITANFGTWNSLHTGPSGADHPDRNAWYESDLYAGATFTVGTWKPGVLYTAYTSPNDAFKTVHEIAFSLAYDDSGSTVAFSPKVLVAIEMDGQADGGAEKGTYVELSARPVFPLGSSPATLAVPLKLGLSARDYYEGPNGSDGFGYFDLGAIVSVPLTFFPGGSWDLHGGVDVLFLGENMETFNGGDSVQPVGLIGLGFVF
jgi:hypothetical protein